MSLAAVATSIAIGVGTTVLSKKIMGDPEMPANIGSGTSPSLSPGDVPEVSPVEGSKVQEFGNFQFENLTSPEDGQQEMILSQLEQAGIDPADLDKYGIAGMAIGGYLNRARGGPLYRENGGALGLLELLREDPELARKFLTTSTTPEITSGIIDVLPEQTEPFNQQAVDADLQNDLLAENLNMANAINAQAAQEAQDYAQLLKNQELVPKSNLDVEQGGIGGWFNEQDPLVQSAITGGIEKIGTSLFMKLLGGSDKPKGSLVRTETLPGNSNRRRSALKMNPIGGSNVTFAKEGSALQRPMFMPHGGAMHGPGGPKDDLIPVMASNGEFMLSKAAVDAAGNGSHAKGIANLQKFNRAGNKRYG